MQLYIYPYPNQTKVQKEQPAHAFLLTTQLNSTSLCGNSTSNTTLAANLARNKSDSEISANVDLHLDFAALLDVAHRSFGKSLASLEDLLADLFGLIVAVGVAVVGVAVGFGG
jgi:hypothetical protein